MSRKLLLAGVVLAVAMIPLTSAAFKLSEVNAGGGVTLGWGKREVPWTLHKKADGTTVAPGTSFDGALAQIQSAFESWHQVPCARIAFKYQGETSRLDIGFDKDNPSNNVNLLVFRDAGLCKDVAPAKDPCRDDPLLGACADKYNCWSHDDATYALTTTSYNIATGQLADADIEFNSTPGIHRYTTESETARRCTSLTDPSEKNCTATDVQNTATHEIGHLIGIDHSSLASATMYYSAEDAEVSKRHLTADDEDAICSIYPTWTVASKEGGCATGGLPVLGASALIVLVSLRNKRKTR